MFLKEKKKCTSQPHLTPTESETLGVGHTVCVFIRPPGDSDASYSLRTTGFKKSALERYTKTNKSGYLYNGGQGTRWMDRRLEVRIFTFL